MDDKRKVGIVLGAGVGRGWAHIGVLEGLAELGIEPDIVCGCSIGALVGASYVTGRLEALADLATSLTWARVLSYMDVSFAGGGLIEGRWVVKFFQENVEDVAIERATPTYGAVATELHTGRETWLTSGSIIDAVRASIAVPGLITPIPIRGRWLVDGALVNPLPVSLCRALGADVILGVSLNGDLVSRPLSLVGEAEPPPDPEANRSTWLRWLSYGLPRGVRAVRDQPDEAAAQAEPDRPGYLEVVGESFFLVQDFVARVRLAADPVDVLIVPDVTHIGLMEFHRADEAIAAGREAVTSARDTILEAVRMASSKADPDALPS
ncbi:MAG: patatin-like phospholipase family protein [Methyloligellaceae bacterium]